MLPRIPVCPSFLKLVATGLCGAKSYVMLFELFIAICIFLIRTYLDEYVTYTLMGHVCKIYWHMQVW